MKSKLLLILCLTSIGSYTFATGTSYTNANIRKQADSQMQGTAAEVEITRKIRDRITSTESLSMHAKNITIVTLGDTVTLSGTVTSQEEVTSLTDIAKKYSGSKIIKTNFRITK